LNIGIAISASVKILGTSSIAPLAIAANFEKHPLQYSAVPFN